MSVFTPQEGVKKIPSHKFLPLMYQLAARMGTKTASGPAEDRGFHDVLYSVIIRPALTVNHHWLLVDLSFPPPPQLILRACLQHPHHTLFIIFALVNANKDKDFCRRPVSKGVPLESSPLDLVRTSWQRWCREGGQTEGWQEFREVNRGFMSDMDVCPGDADVHLLQERSNRAQMIINEVKKKRTTLVHGIDRLCDAYVTLAYMDASKHKNEKSEQF